MERSATARWIALFAVLLSGCFSAEDESARARTTVSLPLTDGSASYETPSDYDADDVVLGDVDGDGDLDVALAADGLDRIFLSGPTGLTQSWQSPLSEDTRSIALGDGLLYADNDGEGVGAGVILAVDGECDDIGEAYLPGDCDDAAPLVFPGATETPDDLIDQDCNGFDATSCFIGDDGNAALNPAAPEVCDAIDQDCDGDLVEGFLDTDGDGIPDCAELVDEDGDGYFGTDCDDSDPDVHPGAGEIPSDGIDQDCNGADTVICFPDDDSDGFGSTMESGAEAGGVCDPDWVLLTGDCDDTNSAINPLAQELCNGVDDDCDGELSPIELIDLDEDGSSACDDCDDEDPTISPDLTEDCTDGVDNDCNGVVDAADSGCDGLLDNDEDGWCPDGVDLNDDRDCSDLFETDPVQGVVGFDCDDEDIDRAPLLLEECDGFDSDCSEQGLSELDDDLDGQRVCDGDCDDEDPNAYRGATEICGDGLDQDCDGSEGTDYDDPDCWETGCSCSSADAEPSGRSLLVLALLKVRRRRPRSRKEPGGLSPKGGSPIRGRYVS